jgi:hypothetical protein
MAICAFMRGICGSTWQVARAGAKCCLPSVTQVVSLSVIIIFASRARSVRMWPSTASDPARHSLLGLRSIDFDDCFFGQVADAILKIRAVVSLRLSFLSSRLICCTNLGVNISNKTYMTQLARLEVRAR